VHQSVCLCFDFLMEEHVCCQLFAGPLLRSISLLLSSFALAVPNLHIMRCLTSLCHNSKQTTCFVLSLKGLVSHHRGEAFRPRLRYKRQTVQSPLRPLQRGSIVQNRPLPREGDGAESSRSQVRLMLKHALCSIPNVVNSMQSI